MNYYNFITNEKELITTLNKENHLHWRWKKYLNKKFYLLISTINFFYLTQFKYSLFIFILGTLALILSNYFFKYRTGEIWCFFVVVIPLIMIPVSYSI